MSEETCAESQWVARMCEIASQANMGVTLTCLPVSHRSPQRRYRIGMAELGVETNSPADALEALATMVNEGLILP